MAEISFSGRHFQDDIILQNVRWNLAFVLSYRDIEEIMQERGFDVDHSTIHRWLIYYSPQLVEKFRSKKREHHPVVGDSTRRTFRLKGRGTITTVRSIDMVRQLFFC